MSDPFKILARYSCGHRGFLLAKDSDDAAGLMAAAASNLCPPCELLRIVDRKRK
jgi:hypothetical protein